LPCSPARVPIAARAVVAGGNGLIAFTATVNGNRDIAVLEPCGSVRALIAGPAAELKPAWSPDGRKLAFMSDRAGSFDIYAAKADGSDVRRLTDDPSNDFNPSWSPDGRRLAWNSDRSGDFEIYVMDASSPDGTAIAFASDRSGRFQLYAMRHDGSRVTGLTGSDASATIPDWQRFPGHGAPPPCRHPW
jgi:TolB protein